MCIIGMAGDYWNKVNLSDVLKVILKFDSK